MREGYPVERCGTHVHDRSRDLTFWYAMATQSRDAVPMFVVSQETQFVVALELLSHGT